MAGRRRCRPMVPVRGRWRAMPARRRRRWRTVVVQARRRRGRRWRVDDTRCRRIDDWRGPDVLDTHARGDVFDYGGLRRVDNRWRGRGWRIGGDGCRRRDCGEAEDSGGYRAPVAGLGGRGRKNEAYGNCWCQKAGCCFGGLVHGVLLSFYRNNNEPFSEILSRMRLFIQIIYLGIFPLAGGAPKSYNIM